MFLERYPIRALVPLECRTLECRTDEWGWPGWWSLASDVRMVRAGQALIVTPANVPIIQTREHILVSQADVDQLTLELNPIPAETMQRFPCLVVSVASGAITCYAHPLNKGTFFYIKQQGYLLLSTSLHDLCRATQSWQPDEQVVEDFLFSAAFVQSDPSRSFIAGISKVPPGSCLIAQHGAIEIHPYWSPHKAPAVHNWGMKDAVHTMRKAMQQATTRAIGDADVVGIHYSGGVDSSAVAGFAKQSQHAHARGSKVVLVSAGNEVATPEEAALRRTFAHETGCQLIEVPLDLTQSILPILRQSNRMAPFPSNGLFAYVDEMLAREASRQGAQVILTGEGGEEIFGDNDQLLADLLRQRKWSAAYHCLGYLTAITQDMRGSLAQSGIKPLADTASTALARTLLTGARTLLQPAAKDAEKMLVPLYGADYAAKARSYRERALCDVQAHVQEGWWLSDYQALRWTLAVAPFDHHVEYLDDVAIKTASPLTDPEVFQASLTLKPAERIRLGVGFRSKPLLRYAAAPVVPAAVLTHAKINVADLPWRILRRHVDDVLAVFQSPVLQQLGIIPGVQREDFVEYPDYGPLHIIQLLILTIWLEELKADVEQHSMPARSI